MDIKHFSKRVEAQRTYERRIRMGVYQPPKSEAQPDWKDELCDEKTMYETTMRLLGNVNKK